MRFNLGLRLEQLGRHAEAEDAIRHAIRVKPDYAEAHGLLGDILLSLGKLDEAITEYRTSIRLMPGLAEAHRCLGLALPRQDKLDEAVAELRLTTLLQPSYAEAYCDLGALLKQQGDYAGALKMYRKGHELGSRRADWPKESAQWVAQAEREEALSARFPALIRGEDSPKDNTERLTLARMAFDRKLFAASARHWSEALANDRELRNDRQADHPYRAAVAAALAGFGLGKDEPPPDDPAKAKLRRKALEDLKIELAARSKLIEAGSPETRKAVARDLSRWKEDRGLAGVRDPEALARLPEAERKEWQAHWAEARFAPEAGSGALSVRDGPHPGRSWAPGQYPQPCPARRPRPCRGTKRIGSRSDGVTRAWNPKSRRPLRPGLAGRSFCLIDL